MEVLIVIDMLNGFCRQGYPLSIPSSTFKIENYIKDRIQRVGATNGKVIFVCDSHLMTDPEIGHPYPPHCMKGTLEAEIIEELRSLAAKAIVLTKNTLSIFLNTGLHELLETTKPSKVEVAGVCTDICVLFAVYELRIRGYNVFVSHEGVLSLTPTKQSEFLDYFRDRLGVQVE